MAEEGTQRRLAAIVAIDVAGYSRLMGADEVGTLAALKAHRAATDPIGQKHGGRIVGTAGDSVLAEFPSVVAAVECAVEIQALMAERNADIPDDKKMLFRIGINLGDVLVDGEEIYGDGINVAARLEALAEPGGICVSRTVRDNVRDKMEIDFEDLGDVEVKNIARPVRVFRVLGEGEKASAPPRAIMRPRWQVLAAAVVLLIFVGGGGAWWWQSQPDFEPVDPSTMVLALPDEPSIAVLPFNYYGADMDKNGYLADGLTETITSALSQVPELLVIARTSSSIFKGKAVDVREVSRQFGVRYVLEGSVQRTDDQIRVTAQLIDAIEGTHVWAKTYDRQFDQILKIQDEITLAIIRDLRGETVGSDWTFSHASTNLDAWLEQIKGFTALNDLRPESIKRGRQFYLNAEKIDPNDAAVKSGLSFTHFLDYRLGYATDRSKSLALAEKYANESLAIDPNNSGGLARLSIIRVLQNKPGEAKELAFRALDSAPSNARIVYTVAWVLKYLGESEESLPYFADAKRLQPRVNWWILGDETAAAIDAGRYEYAKKVIPIAMEVAPPIYRPDYLANLAVAYIKTGNHAKAEELIAEAFSLKPEFSLRDLWIFDYPYVDKAIPERRHAVLRELGVPDEPPPPLPDKPSIAVLSFINLSDDPKQEYFADGMAEDVITDLSKISGLFVIARNSSFSYKGKQVDVRTIARELGVKYVLEGSVRRAGDRVRINAQLIDTTTGGHLWAERYDGTLADVFALQDQVTAKIVAALAVHLSPVEKRRVANKETDNLVAYEAVLKAWPLMRLKTPESYAQALPLFEQAITLDPSYSRAHAGLAALYWEGGFQRGWFDVLKLENQQDGYEKANQHLDIALRQPTPLAHVVKAEILRTTKYDSDGGIAEARRAVELDPNFADGYLALALHLGLAGETNEALLNAEKALRIDRNLPADYQQTIGMVHYVAGDYEAASVSLERTVQRNPSMVFAWTLLAAIYGHLGNQEGAAKSVTVVNFLREKAERQHLSARDAFQWPIKDPLIKQRFFEDLKLGGVSAASVDIVSDDIGGQLTPDEIKQLMVLGRMTGVMIIPGLEHDGRPFNWQIFPDLTSTFQVDGVDYSTQFRFENGSFCNERGCSQFFKLTETGAMKWGRTHVAKEPSGNLYYFTVVSRDVRKN